MLSSPLPIVATPPAPSRPAPSAPAAPAEGPDSFAHALHQADHTRPAEKGTAAKPGPRPGASKATPADDESHRQATASATPADAPPSDGPAPTTATAATADDADEAAAPPADAAALLAGLPPLPAKPQAPAAPGGTRSEGVRNQALPVDERHPALQAAALGSGAGEKAATALAAETFAGAWCEQAAQHAEPRPAEAAPPLPPALATATATQVAASAPVEARIAASPGSADFASQLGVQLSTFVREGIQHARLELHPVELGPVTVQIQLEGHQAQIHLSAEQAPTRQALEQALPTLAGSLREAGLMLSGGGVFEQPRQPANGQPLPTWSRRGREDSAEQTPLPAASAPRRRGVVDLVA